MSLFLESVGEIDIDVRSIQALIAHEGDFMRAYLKRILSSCGLEQIHQVSNGLEALEALTDNECHLLLLDLQLPSMNGLELLELIRSDPRYEKLQVIVVTGISQKRYVRQAIALGVADYILKPFQREFVERRLAAAEPSGQPAQGPRLTGRSLRRDLPETPEGPEVRFLHPR